MDVKKMLESVKDNIAKRNACPRHRFQPPEKYEFGQKHTCLVCGSVMRGPEILFYIRGYEAHGGSADDIWLGYNDPKVHK